MSYLQIDFVLLVKRPLHMGQMIKITHLQAMWLRLAIGITISSWIHLESYSCISTCCWQYINARTAWTFQTTCCICHINLCQWKCGQKCRLLKAHWEMSATSICNLLPITLKPYFLFPNFSLICWICSTSVISLVYKNAGSLEFKLPKLYFSFQKMYCETRSRKEHCWILWFITFYF